MSNFSNFPDTIGMSEIRKSTAELNALVAADGLIVGRFYYNTDLAKLYRALAVGDLGEPYVRGTSAVDDIAAQFNAHVSVYNTFVSATNDALADRPTLAAADGRFLAIEGKAVDSDKLDGKTYATIAGTWQTDVANAIRNLRNAFGDATEIGGLQLADSATITLADLVSTSSIGKTIASMDTAKVQVFTMFSSPTHTATVTLPGGGTQVVSNGDSFIFPVAAGVAGTVTFINNLENDKFAAIDTLTAQHTSDIAGLTTRTGAGNATSIVDGVLGFGGGLLRDTNVTGGKYIHYQNTGNVFNVLMLQCIDDSTKFVRIAGHSDGGIRFGIQPFTPFS